MTKGEIDMKRTSIVFAVCLFALTGFSVPAAVGQDTGSGIELDAYVSNLTKRLNLTEEQQPKVRAIISASAIKSRATMARFRNRNSGQDRSDVRSLRKELQSIRRSTGAQLAGVLTETQMAAFGGMQAEMQRSQQNRMRTPKSGQPMSRDYPNGNYPSGHAEFKVAGTVFSDNAGTEPQPGATVSFTDPAGKTVILEPSDADGGFASTAIPDGRYLIQIGSISSRTWHVIPEMGNCKACHKPGGNGSVQRTTKLDKYHTRIPSDNDCAHCHYFPETESVGELKTAGVLNGNAVGLALPPSTVEINGKAYPFDPSAYSIQTVRSDVFAPGYFSLFDTILAVAAEHRSAIEYAYDDAAKTHWITSVDGVPGRYWYRWVFDTGKVDGRPDLDWKRNNRWDENLWRPGATVRLVDNENVAELSRAYHAEIKREKKHGHVVGNAIVYAILTQYIENPLEPGRRRVARQHPNLMVTPHDLRATGYPSPYSKPFQPGVVTVLDIALSLRDQGKLDLVLPVFFDYIGGCYIHAHFVQALGIPGVGIVHNTGLQGWVCRTQLSTVPNSLDDHVNDAQPSVKMPLDLQVIHAPDYSLWHWAGRGTRNH